ncbi:MAG TPA: hypothetical protein VGD62_00115 [Acidobacteriaceae bacterium]
MSPLNLLAGGVLLLVIFDIALGTKLALAWHEASSDQSEAYAADMARYTLLAAQVQHIGGLPASIAGSRDEAEAFYGARVPGNDSAILAELGGLASRNRVRLSRASYTPRAAVPGLVEQSIDASLSGEYTALMHFINDVERDRNHAFFIIRNVTLTGQQSGVVNLRLRLTTYMRADAASAAIMASSGRPAAEVQ